VVAVAVEGPQARDGISAFDASTLTPTIVPSSWKTWVMPTFAANESDSHLHLDLDVDTSRQAVASGRLGPKQRITIRSVRLSMLTGCLRPAAVLQIVEGSGTSDDRRADVVRDPVATGSQPCS